MPRWSLAAWVFFVGVVALGAGATLSSLQGLYFKTHGDLWWLAMVGLMPFLARHYIQLPNVNGRICPTGILTQLGALRYGAAEGVILAVVEAFVVSRQQSSDSITRTLFNIGAMSFSIFLAGIAGEAALGWGSAWWWVLVSAMVVALTYFALNVGLVMGMMTLTAGLGALKHARVALLWSWAPYVVGGLAAGGITLLGQVGVEALGGLVIGGASLGVTVLALKQYFEALKERDNALGEVESLLGELKLTHLASLKTLASAIEAKDPMNHGHSVRVQHLATHLAAAMGIEGDELEAVRVAAMLHDVGKLAVPEYLLHPNRKLNLEDQARLQSHAQLGAAILSASRLHPKVVPAIRHHHERYDGAGFPGRLGGEDIPLEARILAVADAFDKLRNPRSGQGLSVVESAEQLERAAGHSLDPALVSLAIKDGYRLLYEAEKLGQTVAEEGISKDATTALEAFEWQNRESLVVFWLSERLRESTEPKVMMAALAEAIENLVGCDRVGIFVPHLTRPQSLEVAACRGCTEEQAESLVASQWPARLLSSMDDEAAKVIKPEGDHAQKGSERWALFSLDIGNLERGLVIVSHEEAVEYDGVRLRAMKLLVSQSARALANARAFLRYQQQSITDALTGLYNARHLRSEALHMIQGCLERGQRGCAVMIDLNGFKAINDELGHDAGDVLLVEVSRTLVANVRKGDLVIRRGGDEFVMMFPDISEEAVAERIDRIYAEASAHWPDPWPYARGTSAGVAWFPEDGKTLDNLLKVADERMYADKQAKRATREEVVKAMNG